MAVKTLKEGSGEEDRVKFLQEAAIMGQFKHPNVVEMYGVVQGEPVSCLINTKRNAEVCKRLYVVPSLVNMLFTLVYGQKFPKSCQ